jgi:ceramide glucosyltransferase
MGWTRLEVYRSIAALGMLYPAVSQALLILSLASLAYLAFAVFRTRWFARRPVPTLVAGPPVTILKPVCGDEPHLYENLASFCHQDYPVFQVVFGVRDFGDPAVPIVERIMREFPEQDIGLVASHRVFGGNYKASNLANMYEAAKHELLVVADSDMRVDRRYLAAIVRPLLDPAVGAVTCLYAGRPSGGVWSALGAMFVNEWFVPSVLVARAHELVPLCFGSTMALRRDVLEAIGGFAALADHLADDYVLGALVKRRGLRMELSSYVVENVISETSFRSLWSRELRWARTVRSVQPIGYSLSFVTYALPLSFGYLIVSGGSALASALLGMAVLLRLAAQTVARRALGTADPARPWLVPLRDALCLIVWAASFFGRTVRWRGQEICVRRGGRLASEPRCST